MAAQLQVGDEVSLKANATFSAGYTGTYGNDVQSGHGLDLGFSGSVTGYYYNPNFISFAVNPYFNQSRANSDFQSVTNATGVSASANIFNGSHFPGSVQYTRSYNHEGSFAVPGIGNYTTVTNGQSIGVNWSELIPGLPSLSTGFVSGSERYSLPGAQGDGSAHFHSLFLNSGYTWNDYRLNAGFSMGSNNSVVPDLFSTGSSESRSNNKNLNFGMSHPLPWNGGYGVNYNRAWLHSDYLGYKFDGNIDTLVGTASMHPTERFSMSFSTNYSDNLSGSLYEAVIPGTVASTTAANPVVAGAVTSTSSSSHSWDGSFTTTYFLGHNFTTNTLLEQRQQYFLGKEYASTGYGGGLNYNRRIAGGALGAGFFASGNYIDTTGENGFGFSAVANFGRRIGPWTTNAMFDYSQNVQTLLITYTSSNYTVSGNIGRKFGKKLFWNGAASLFHTGLVQYAGTSAKGQSYSMSFGTGRLAVGGGYSKSSGSSLLSSAGLVTTTLPPLVPNQLLNLYGGEGYSASLSGNPTRRLTFSASYNKSRINATNQGVNSWNNSEQQAFYFQYQLRQINLNGGYTRIIQGFSASSAPPADVSSFFIGFSRWFNFF